MRILRIDKAIHCCSMHIPDITDVRTIKIHRITLDINRLIFHTDTANLAVELHLVPRCSSRNLRLTRRNTRSSDHLHRTA